jgi:hypothetical protein
MYIRVANRRMLITCKSCVVLPIQLERELSIEPTTRYFIPFRSNRSCVRIIHSIRIPYCAIHIISTFNPSVIIFRNMIFLFYGRWRGLRFSVSWSSCPTKKKQCNNSEKTYETTYYSTDRSRRQSRRRR